MPTNTGDPAPLFPELLGKVLGQAASHPFSPGLGAGGHPCSPELWVLTSRERPVGGEASGTGHSGHGSRCSAGLGTTVCPHAAFRPQPGPAGTHTSGAACGLWGLDPDCVVPGKTSPSQAWVSSTGPFYTDVWLLKLRSLPEAMLNNRKRPLELGFGHLHWRVCFPCPPVGLPGTSITPSEQSGGRPGTRLSESPRALPLVPTSCAAWGLPPARHAHWAPALASQPHASCLGVWGYRKPVGPGAWP